METHGAGRRGDLHPHLPQRDPADGVGHQIGIDEGECRGNQRRRLAIGNGDPHRSETPRGSDRGGGRCGRGGDLGEVGGCGGCLGGSHQIDRVGKRHPIERLPTDHQPATPLAGGVGFVDCLQNAEAIGGI